MSDAQASEPAKPPRTRRHLTPALAVIQFSPTMKDQPVALATALLCAALVGAPDDRVYRESDKAKD